MLEIMLLIVLLALFKLCFVQIGPTCGFYALVYAISKVKFIQKRKTVRNLIINSIKAEDSVVGEIFDIYKFQEIGRRHFPDIPISVQDFSSIEELDKLLEDNYLIYPIRKDEIPHYYFIEKAVKGGYKFRNGIFILKSSVEKVKIIELHNDLHSYNDFEWNIYLETTNKLKLAKDILYRMMDFKLYSFLRKNEKSKIDSLKDTTIDVNLAGKVLAIKKVK